MRKAKVLSCSLVMNLMVLLPNYGAQNPGMRFNREGWNMPDTKKLVHIRSGTLKLSEIEEEVKTEEWELPKGSSYRITAFYPWHSGPVSEEVGWLVIYRAPDDKILCWEYGRLLRDKKSGQELGGILSFLADLDNDGRYESRFEGVGEKMDKPLLASLIRVKLGKSKETDLVIRLVKAALGERKDGN